MGFCGQVPSDSPEFAAFLVKENIDSISLNPDSVIKVIERIAEIERGPIPTLRIQTVPIKEKFSKFWRRAVKHQYAQ